MCFSEFTQLYHLSFIKVIPLLLLPLQLLIMTL